jgi:hypothetical protein
MPRGGPDYGLETLNIGRYSTDTAELAARLGSPYSIYRSGHVLYITDFQDGVDDWLTFFGAGIGSIARAINGWRGPACLGLLPDSAGGSLSNATKIFPFVISTKIGTEIFANWESTGPLNNSALEIAQLQYIKPNSYVGRVIIDPVTKTISLATDNPVPGGTVTIATGLDEWRSAFVSNYYQWAKLVIDWSTGKYDYLYWNNNVYDLSMYYTWNVHGLGAGYTGLLVGATHAATSTWLDIGAAIITIDEP